MENKQYVAIGEEATRGTAEATTVGFVPVTAFALPTMEFDDKDRADFRGESTVLGETTKIRMSQKWSGSLEIPFFTHGGTVAGMVGTLLKHFFGKSASGQNAATGQYYHMLYPVADPFATANLGTKGLTLNMNFNESATVKNHAFKGGRVKGLTFNQETGAHLMMTVDMMGQTKTASGTAIASPAFAGENLRCDYNNLTVYTGTITRTGTGPDFTQFAFGSAITLKPDNVSLTLENGMEDKLRLSGTDYPDKTNMGKYKATLEMTIDLEDPTSGFSSVDEWESWLAAVGTTNFFFLWDTGTQAGTGDNHGLYIDLPRMVRMGGEPSFDREKDSTITLKYEGQYSATAAYLVGIMLKNTATAL